MEHTVKVFDVEEHRHPIAVDYAKDSILHFHYDATCVICRYTIFAFDPMIVRQGKRMHARCSGYTNLDDLLKLQRYPVSQDRGNPEVDLKAE